MSNNEYPRIGNNLLNYVNHRFPYGMPDANEELTKQANMLARGGKMLWNYGKHLLGHNTLGQGGLGGTLKFVGKHMGATGTQSAKKFTSDWKRLADGTYKSLSGATNMSMADKIYHAGDRLSNFGRRMSAGWQGNLNRLNQRTTNFAGKHFSPEMAKRLGKYTRTTAAWGAPLAATGAWVANDAYLGDSALGKPISWAGNTVMNASGIGMGITAVTKGMDWGKRKITGMALDGAEQAAQMTAQEMARGQQQAGSMAHLFGAWDPESYAQQSVERASQSISERFAEMRRQQGLS